MVFLEINKMKIVLKYCLGVLNIFLKVYIFGTYIKIPILEIKYFLNKLVF